MAWVEGRAGAGAAAVVVMEEVTEVKEAVMGLGKAPEVQMVAKVCMRARRGRRRCLWHR